MLCRLYSASRSTTSLALISNGDFSIVALLFPFQAGARPVSLPPAPDRGSLPMML
jgi:hypothetical protein